MKLMKVTHIIFLLVTLSLFSCSDDPDPKPEPQITSIVLSSDALEIELGQKVAFTVIANTKEELTDKVTYLVNNEAIVSHTFTPQALGSYEIMAKYENLKSNTINLKVNKVTAKAITLSVTKEQIKKGETITISVNTDTNEDVSAEAKVYINDNLIKGNKFTPETFGEYTMHATYGKLTSEKVKVTVLGDIQVSFDKEQLLIGESVTIKVKKENGDNISNEAAIYVNGNKIEGLSFTPNTVGTYTVYATYQEDTKSEEVNFFAVTEQTSFQKNPVVEAFVHLKCPYCPRIYYALELVKKQTDFIIPISLHPITRSTWVDFLYQEDAMKLFSELIEPASDGYRYLPNAAIDRKREINEDTSKEQWKNWKKPQPENLNEVLDLVDDITYTGLALELKEIKQKMELTVKVSFMQDFNEQLNLVVFVLENNIIHDYPNKTKYYNGVNPIKDFVSNHVFRKPLTDIYGDNISLNSVTKNTIYKQDFSFDVPNNISNTNEMSIVVMVTKANSREIINARVIKIGEARQKFEFK